MKMLDKFGLRPKKLEIEFEGEKQYFFAKPISYNLAVFIANEFNNHIRQLVIVRHCLCEEDGTLVFDENADLDEIGDKFPYEVISLMSAEISRSSGPVARSEDLAKKPEA